MSGPLPPVSSRGGFSLVEVVVAMLLISVVAVGLMSYTGFVAHERILSKQRALGLVAAQEAIDYVRSKPFDEVTAGTELVTTTVARIPLTVATTIEVTKPNMKLVVVSVINADGQTLQRFVTAIFRPVGGG